MAARLRLFNAADDDLRRKQIMIGRIEAEIEKYRAQENSRDTVFGRLAAADATLDHIAAAIDYAQKSSAA